MSWIVIGEENGSIKLVSKTESDHELPGILPKGSFLTIDEKKSDAKFILRVDDSIQYEPFKPSPLIADMDLTGLFTDSTCQNILNATRVKTISSRKDGKLDFIHPRSFARRSNQEEVDLAFGNIEKGPRVFLATVQGGENQKIIDEAGKNITVRLPDDMFFHQMQIAGKTGSGKTVAMKYLAQYFVENLGGAVLAINVKDKDLLTMDAKTVTDDPEIIREWENLDLQPHGISTATIYYPATTDIRAVKNINYDIAHKITLDVQTIEPESLSGLLQNISDVGAQNLPDIFRYWQANEDSSSFKKFVDYFNSGQKNPVFQTQNIRGDVSSITLHPGTHGNISRSLNSAQEFFDNEGAQILDETDILYPGKLSVINVTGKKGVQFGSILLRDLLAKIVKAKSNQKSDVPILVIIDEVHQFYNTSDSREALDDLDTICRTGRSQKIGVIFASQNINDIPKGLSSVINTKIIFRSDGSSGQNLAIRTDDLQSLSPGYAAVSVHNVPQLKIVKFPLSLAGV